jgi:Ribbon-helix-helix protein, copG family
VEAKGKSMTGRKSKNTKRVQIDMSEKALARLEWLREATDSTTIAEVIRDAIEFREAAVRLAAEGQKIYAEDEKTGKRTYLLLP